MADSIFDEPPDRSLDANAGEFPTPPRDDPARDRVRDYAREALDAGFGGGSWWLGQQLWFLALESDHPDLFADLQLRWHAGQP